MIQHSTMDLSSNVLLRSVHSSLKSPELVSDVHLVRGDYIYYHYGVDGVNDFGWGCGFRVLQTICSWMDPTKPTVSISDMIAVLDNIADPSWNPEKSKRPWIGCYEAFLVIDALYDVACRIVHVPNLSSFKKEISLLQNHFDNCGSPVFLGGNRDCYGKCILGTCKICDRDYFLILDPHFRGVVENLSEGVLHQFLKWTCTEELEQDSFYNMLLPLCHGKLKYAL